MRSRNKAVSTVAIAAIVVVIVAIAGIGAYFFLTQSSTNSTQTTSFQTSSASSHSSSTSGSQSSTTSSSTSSSLSTSTQQTRSSSGQQNSVTSIPLNLHTTHDLFGNFSSLALRSTKTCSGQCSKAGSDSANLTESLAYISSGTRTINSTTYNVYNFTESSSYQVPRVAGNSTTSNLTWQFLLAPGNGTDYQVVNGTAHAIDMTQYYGEVLIYPVHSSSSIYKSYQLLNQSSTVLNGVHLSLSAYLARASDSGINYSLTIVIATIQGTSVSFPLSSFSTHSFQNGYEIIYTMRITYFSRA